MTLLDRFESKYIPDPNSGCWHWIGACSSKGYGRINAKGINRSAHRISYEVHKGRIPKGLCVMHKCDTPCCVNPHHLITGTQAENIADMVRKGRHKKIISDETIEKIRMSSGTHQEIGDRYGVSQGYVTNIINAKVRQGGES